MQSKHTEENPPQIIAICGRYIFDANPTADSQNLKETVNIGYSEKSFAKSFENSEQ